MDLMLNFFHILVTENPLFFYDRYKKLISSSWIDIKVDYDPFLLL